jgi:hypothetical protein
MIDALPTRTRTLMSRMGKAAFLFFLAKGLLWLALPALYYWTV